MKREEHVRRTLAGQHVALFQLHAADTVLEASLPTHSSNMISRTAEAFYLGSSREKTSLRFTRTFLLLSGGMAESAECGSAMYLGGRRDSFTVTPGPRTSPERRGEWYACALSVTVKLRESTTSH